ncbi:MAG: peptidyl-prolyl cis-trans isomerase, partial [bacterium]
MVAKVGRDPITDMEVASRLQRLPASYQEVVRTADGQKEFMDSIVRERLVLQKARELGVDKRPEVKERMARARKLLERRLEDTLNEVLITETLREIRKSDIGVTDAEVSAFYDQHPERYSNPVETRASHILVGTEAEAQGALTRLKGGTKFDALGPDFGEATLL